MAPETEPLDVLTIGEMVVDFISVEKTDTLSNAATFERHLGGSPVNVAKLGGHSAVVSKTGIEAFAKSELQRHGVSIEYLVMDHRNRTTVAFVSSTSGKPDFEIARSGDYLLKPEEIPDEAVERAREVAEMKLTRTGPMPDEIDRGRSTPASKSWTRTSPRK